MHMATDDSFFTDRRRYTTDGSRTLSLLFKLLFQIRPALSCYPNPILFLFSMLFQPVTLRPMFFNASLQHQPPSSHQVPRTFKCPFHKLKVRMTEHDGTPNISSSCSHNENNKQRWVMGNSRQCTRRGGGCCIPESID